MSTLSLHELYNLNKEKQRKQVIIYNKILEMSSNKIRNIGIYGGFNCFFTIPTFVLGLPLYDIHKCIDYIVDSWRKKGFLVQRLPEPNVNTIYISWSPSDVNKKHTIRNY
tara:strand:- start:4764 stop:5093 length:330 start_codon:yes stop_codon:yes gene_type:complete